MPVMPDSPFRLLARTHALMAMGDASMYGALAGSVLFNLSPDAQREKVLLYLLVSVAPFAVVAPAIGPTVDRIPGGRRAKGYRPYARSDAGSRVRTGAA